MSKIKNKIWHLVLASASPRRKQLLEYSGLKFTIHVTDILEESHFTHPAQVAMDLAKQKGDHAFLDITNKDSIINPLIVAADTVVALQNKIYGKPTSIADAARILMELSGHEHEVFTGIYLKRKIEDRLQEYSFVEKTSVKFDQITPDVLHTYLQTGESLDKAGAYGIQASGLTFIDTINGSYSNVVGFPLNRFLHELKIFLGAGPDDTGAWRGLLA